VSNAFKAWSYRVAGVLVSVFFVYLAVRKVDLSESVAALASVRPGWLVAAVVVYLSSFPVRALRWRLILRAQKDLSLGEIMGPVFVGYMANNVLPARAGEIYRAHFLGRRVRMSRSGVAASIVVERAFDGLMLVAVILLVFAMFPEAGFLGGAALVMGLAFLTLAAGILFYVLVADRTHKVTDRLLGLLPERLRGPVGVRLGFFLRGMRGVSTAGDLLAAVGYSVLVWVLEAGAIALVVTAFGIPLPVAGYVLVFALAALSTTLPSGPGYVGPYQYAFVLALGYFAVPSGTALAVSVTAQLALLGSVTLIGLVLLWAAQLRRDAPPKRVGREVGGELEAERERVG
jgi:uncharacterized protein (TIRG00374 family)